MSASFTIYNGAKLEFSTGEASLTGGSHCGWIEFTVTEVDGTEHEITIHFDVAEGFAAVKQLDHIAKAINSTKEAA